MNKIIISILLLILTSCNILHYFTKSLALPESSITAKAHIGNNNLGNSKKNTVDKNYGEANSNKKTTIDATNGTIYVVNSSDKAITICFVSVVVIFLLIIMSFFTFKLLKKIILKSKLKAKSKENKNID